jgi:hypothetical protein
MFTDKMRAEETQVQLILQGVSEIPFNNERYQQINQQLVVVVAPSQELLKPLPPSKIVENN